jgi:hypothetical protein
MLADEADDTDETVESNVIEVYVSGVTGTTACTGPIGSSDTVHPTTPVQGERKISVPGAPRKSQRLAGTKHPLKRSVARTLWSSAYQPPGKKTKREKRVKKEGRSVHHFDGEFNPGLSFDNYDGEGFMRKELDRLDNKRKGRKRDTSCCYSSSHTDQQMLLIGIAFFVAIFIVGVSLYGGSLMDHKQYQAREKAIAAYYAGNKTNATNHLPRAVLCPPFLGTTAVPPHCLQHTLSSNTGYKKTPVRRRISDHVA